MRSSLLTSLIAHAVFLGIIVLPALWTGKTVTTQVMNVKLVAEEKPRPAPPEPEPEKKPEVVREEKPPEPEKKVEPKMTYKPEKKTTKKKTEPKPETVARKTEEKPSEPSGGSTVRVDDPDFRFAYYLEIIRERVGHNWSPPPVSGTGSATSSVIYFRISKTGGIADTKVEKKSGYDLFDKAALRAIKLCDPLPPLPAGYKSKWLGVHFEFEQKSEQP